MSITNRFMVSFRNAHLYGGEDRDGAIHLAIDTVFSLESDERKAHLFSMLVENWDEYPHGVLRRIYLKDVFFRWNQDHLFNRTPALKKEKK